MRLFRRHKPKQRVGNKSVTIDETMVASIKEATMPKPRRSRYIVEGINARKELERIAREKQNRTDR